MTPGALLREASAGLRESLRDLVWPWRGRPDLSPTQAGSALARKIACQQFRNLMAEMPANVLAAGIGVLLWWVALWHLSPGPRAAWWVGVILFLVLTMTVFMRLFTRAQPPDDALHRWEVVFARMNQLMGCAWGTVGVAVVPDHQLSYAPYVSIGLLLVVAGSLSLYATYRPSISWLVPPCLTLTVLYLMAQGDVLNMVIGLGFLVVGILMLRLARMHNSQLTQSMRAAEERVVLLEELEGQRAAAHAANEAKTRFLANVSHDLRQPMHSIALLTSALRQRMGADSDVAAQIGASVQTMDDMLCALLEVSRLDAGTLPLQVATMPLDVLFERIELQFAPQARAKHLSLRIQPCEAQVTSDAYQLQRVMANLVANAIRYTDAGDVIVRCRLRGSTAWLQVWDSGRGIARQDRQRIFEEFVQVAHGRSLGSEGLGLGLAIVHRVAQRLGHRVVLRSRPGRGSLFAIGVPVSGSARSGAASRSEERQLAALLQGQLILLIDDDPVVLHSMQALLEAFQCHVLAAGSRSDALKAVDDSLRTPDMVISDFRLGEPGTGLDAIDQVRERIGEAIPALLVTADVAVARTAAHPRGIPVLAKPLQAGTLAAELGRALRSAVQPPEEGAPSNASRQTHRVLASGEPPGAPGHRQ